MCSTASPPAAAYHFRTTLQRNESLQSNWKKCRQIWHMWCILSASFCSCGVRYTSRGQGWSGFVGVVKYKVNHPNKRIEPEVDLKSANKEVWDLINQTVHNTLLEVCLLWIVIGPDSLLCAYTSYFMAPESVGMQSVVLFRGKKSRFKEKKKKKSVQTLPVQFSVSGKNALLMKWFGFSSDCREAEATFLAV